MKFILLAFALCCAINCPEQDNLAAFKSYKMAVKQLQVISYSVQRIDTIAGSTIWNHSGKGIMQRNNQSHIAGATFWSLREDTHTAYFYDGNNSTGLALDERAHTAETEQNPFPPGVLGRPGGQMVVEEFFALDSTYDSVTYCPNPTGPLLRIHYPDEPTIDVRNHNTYLLLDSTSGLPRQIRTVMLRGGKKWSTIKIIKNLQINNASDAAFLLNKSFLTGYKLLNKHAPLTTSTLVGQPAPDFRLHSFTQVPVHLRNYQGQTVLLAFWETSCSPCIAAMPKLQLLQKRYQHLIVLGVLLEAKNTEQATGILARQQAFYLNLLGNKAIQVAYHVTAFPKYVLIGRSGKVIYESEGYTDELEEAIRQVIQ